MMMTMMVCSANALFAHDGVIVGGLTTVDTARSVATQELPGTEPRRLSGSLDFVGESTDPPEELAQRLNAVRDRLGLPPTGDDCPTAAVLEREALQLRRDAFRRSDGVPVLPSTEQDTARSRLESIGAAGLLVEAWRVALGLRPWAEHARAVKGARQSGRTTRGLLEKLAAATLLPSEAGEATVLVVGVTDSHERHLVRQGRLLAERLRLSVRVKAGDGPRGIAGVVEYHDHD